GGGGIAVVLDEVRVLGREPGPPDPQAAAAGGVEQLARGAVLGGLLGGVLERRAERLDAGRLSRLAPRPHVRERCLDLGAVRLAERERGPGDDLAGSEARAAIREAELLGGPS